MPGAGWVARGYALAPEGNGKPGHVLTVRQRKILSVYRRFGDVPPSMREIGEAVGLSSVSSVSYQIHQLTELGYLTRHLGTARGGPQVTSVSPPRDHVPCGRTTA